METSKLKKFAQYARRNLIDEVAKKLQRVLSQESTARRENPRAVTELEKLIAKSSEEQVIEKIAYIWFNRFCALRFMDVNRFTRIGVLSPVVGQFQPEILAEAKMGHIDENSMPEKTRLHITALLNGTTPSDDPQTEAYRLLIVAACNQYHQAMPYLFERIADYTELLMLDDLLSGNSILAYTREAMTPKVCIEQVEGKDKPVVEVIGWLYQFYIAEKKDVVFAGLKKNKKITPENIPAATQLFTPHYIVCYLVENSVGRLWMLNHPDSSLIEKMDYYIKPEQQETDFLKIQSPEEIKICDPACGSGHMLTYAFDLLYLIYEEQGYEANEIPEKILTHNLYGIEIDERAGEVAAFALTMKAREKQRRFFRKPIQPNICILEAIHFEEQELNEYMDFVGRDLFTLGLENTLRQFEEADNFGSLIRPEVTDVANMLETLASKDFTGQLFLGLTHQKVLQVLKQADYLSPKYHVVIANPPYMGGKGMNARLGKWAKDNYPNSKSDLFAMFMERNIELAQKQGVIAMITMHSWMFLSSFEKLRSCLLGQNIILSMAHMGARAFDSIGGEVVQTTAFVLENSHKPDYKGGYLRLVDGKSEAEKEFAIREAIKNPDCGWFYRVSAVDFNKIPSSPIAYWVSNKIFSIFDKTDSLGAKSFASEGIKSGNNDKYLRLWHEINFSKIGTLDASNIEWVYHHKGGEYRKWAGNQEFAIYWKNNGELIRSLPNSGIQGERTFKENAAIWSDITSGGFSARLKYKNHLFDSASPSGFLEITNDYFLLLAFLNSKVVSFLTPILNPTLHFKVGNFRALPFAPKVKADCSNLINQSQKDWDTYETSWGFQNNPLIVGQISDSVTRHCAVETVGLRDKAANPTYTLSEIYADLHKQNRETILQMQQLEEENNRIFIEAYGLQDELTPDVPLKEITLTCNPHYRYGGNKSDAELEAQLLADTMKEFISYAVGCMFGRYSLDKPGLILANQGDTIADYFQQIPESTFPADADNVIPLLDGDWFTDDISERFFQFLKVTFGDEHYQENLAFIEQALGKDIRKYFLKDFYNDHLKRYKKRPIYWLFSSPKGSFNALIYMHRYRPDTISVVLNDYLREFRTKLSARVDHLQSVEASADASKTEKTKALKEITKLNKMLVEMEQYEREVLYPLATKQIEIDLDEGVKVNYAKFGSALKKVPGL